jgi:hypothetical protein
LFVEWFSQSLQALERLEEMASKILKTNFSMFFLLFIFVVLVSFLHMKVLVWILDALVSKFMTIIRLLLS